ncbi:anhydro-N-acetylmuramic acid kinase [Rhodoferax sp.]|uniref:anhydro-N-acetylmuramic acid kinase n=1 Tax=Rhodoferax sp. TaxID=50421 RepID=UPI0037847C95
MSLKPELYIGLMSGTSLDGVDGVLVDFAGDTIQVQQHATLAFPESLRAEFLALNTGTTDELHRAALAGNALARLYAQVVAELLARSGKATHSIVAVGAHGQTVRHRPRDFDATGYTLQINQPALLSELCGMDVVADFRSRDLAAGGQGAPLVPPFHAAFFGTPGVNTAVLNIGGISNLTVLRPPGGSALLGFDCGPGNALLDGWCASHTGKAYDDNGSWAASGQVLPALLERMLAEPFFALAPPKSTGRDLFNREWLDRQLAQTTSPQRPQDVQATLTELTAQVCADSVLRHAPGCDTLVVCGGGALNGCLMQRIAARLAPKAVISSEARGLPPLQVEATAFAWLARQAVLRKPIALESVTGARGARILGAIYHA